MSPEQIREQLLALLVEIEPLGTLNAPEWEELRQNLRRGVRAVQSDRDRQASNAYVQSLQTTSPQPHNVQRRDELAPLVLPKQ